MLAKQIFLVSCLIFSAAPAFAEEVVQRGNLVVDHCVAVLLPNGRNNPFSPDRCRPEAVAGIGKSCQVTVESSGGVASEVTMGTSLWSRGGAVPVGHHLGGGSMFRSYGKNGLSNYELNGFSGRIRGNVVLLRDKRGNEMAASKMEIYDNLDGSGPDYVRYRCANLHSVRTAEAEATVQPASLDGKDPIENDDGSFTTAI